jgi:hypothetical protein
MEYSSCSCYVHHVHSTLALLVHCSYDLMNMFMLEHALTLTLIILVLCSSMNSLKFNIVHQLV